MYTYVLVGLGLPHPPARSSIPTKPIGPASRRILSLLVTSPSQNDERPKVSEQCDPAQQSISAASRKLSCKSRSSTKLVTSTVLRRWQPHRLQRYFLNVQRVLQSGRSFSPLAVAGEERDWAGAVPNGVIPVNTCQLSQTGHCAHHPRQLSFGEVTPKSKDSRRSRRPRHAVSR